LGYVATMIEAGVPVVYAYIADAHDNRGPALSGVTTAAEGTFGPGEAGYVKQLQAYDKAFGQFFARLAADKFTTSNTLFVITADENDHFAGGPPSPANCDGVTTPCTYAKKGEIDIDLSQLMATEFGEGSPFLGCTVTTRRPTTSTGIQPNSARLHGGSNMKLPL
jgi:hypothetical protein